MEKAFFQRVWDKFVWATDYSARSQSLTQEQKKLLEWFDGGSKTDAGVRVNSDATLSYAAAWRCINLLSQDLAKLPFNMYKRSKQGKKIAFYHPAHYLMKSKPNGWMTPYVFRQTLTRHALLKGNGYARIIRNGAAQPTQLKLIANPDYVQIKMVDDEIYYDVNEVLPDGKLASYVLHADDMFHLKGPSMNGIEGMSMITYHRETLGLGMAAKKTAERFYGRGSNFSGFIKMPEGKKLDSTEQVDRLSKSWTDKYRGLHKSWSTPVLEDGATFVPVTMPLKDAQFLESRQYSGIEVCQIYGVPPHKIYDLSRATFSNIEHQSIEYVGDSLLPHVTNWEQEIKEKLLREDEKAFDPGTGKSTYYPKFNLGVLLRGDSKTRAEFYSSAVQNGWMNRNQVAALEDYDQDIPGGDKYTIQLNMQELKNVGHEQPE
ncbi:phage portal protein [Rapidithrix thailandica]|uniref:Phage portal protein n=1 Tax=Rapidithrix thailandica TaxID=413964 RepID=A0AAW9S286_9BACT